eukprot:scaffold10163_cov71-Cyclotella_meneghiniana.AAC.2
MILRGFRLAEAIICIIESNSLFSYPWASFRYAWMTSLWQRACLASGSDQGGHFHDLADH